MIIVGYNIKAKCDVVPVSIYLSIRIRSILIEMVNVLLYGRFAGKGVHCIGVCILLIIINGLMFFWKAKVSKSKMIIEISNIKIGLGNHQSIYIIEHFTAFQHSKTPPANTSQMHTAPAAEWVSGGASSDNLIIFMVCRTLILSTPHGQSIPLNTT